MDDKITSSEIQELIVGFLNGSLSDNELNRLNDWLDQDRAHLDEFNRIRSAWVLGSHKTVKSNFNASVSWLRLKREIEKKTGISSPAVIPVYLKPLRYAASLFICFALGAAVTAVVMRDRSVEPAATESTTIITAPLGSKSNITLPDGSNVWLNAGSTITYSAEFDKENREINLTGEAFFDVKSDSLKPFHVHTSGMTVRAKGTRFNVKAYADDNTMAATLEEGRLDVVIRIPGKADLHPIVLKPKEQLIVQKSQSETGQMTTERGASSLLSKQTTPNSLPIKEVTIRPNVKTELSTSWKDEKWIIDDEPLVLFVTDLERRYNLEIVFASNELKDYKFSGTIENQTAEQILTALSLAAPVNYKFDNNNVVLSLNQKDKEKFSKILKSKK